MDQMLWLTPATPLAGFVALALLGPHIPRRIAALIGCGSVAVSALLSLALAARYLGGPLLPVRVALWTWMSVGPFNSDITLLLDPLSLVMMCVVSIVGFLIHLYSVEFMSRDEGFSRFFAYMNLFVSSMLILVLAGDLVLLLLGWEGVGLCSYLLIGFWYTEPVNGRAARKAFIVTRVGDTALLLGLFALFYRFNTLDITVLLHEGRALPPGDKTAFAAGLLLLGGALGKSAQIPLQVWLPDAMAGPSPVSALIHAATMVTAGVYLIARMNVLYLAAPDAQFVVACVGALTLLVAACSALVTIDLKRVLAYSTISQIGYMFLALGIGAWSAAVFHLVTHAFFKSLLFLAAGIVIHSLHEEHDIFKMGGLRRSLPVTFWTFLAGAASLAALPFVTAGFFSKDEILIHAAEYPSMRPFLWAGLAGSLLTSLYAFRLVFVVFFGEERIRPQAEGGPLVRAPLILLAMGSLAGGVLIVPGSLGPGLSIQTLLSTVFPGPPAEAARAGVLFRALLVLFPLIGLAGAFWLFRLRTGKTAKIAARPTFHIIQKLWRDGWGFDWVYTKIIVEPFMALASLSRDDPIDLIYRGFQSAHMTLYRWASLTQTGQIRAYLTGIVVGAIFFLGMMVFL